ncbi:unnamed protein product [Cylicocyclus nassatus]|uniref:Acyl-CoA thioesterase II n=1 Tax=Cylicocyclus nassatus TaxID=53992 RepID=A0AA36HFM1_CYLNA|nr:unnamed protein product [Cylicocyclus nassatus]
MHCYFVKAGSVLEPVDYHVERIRDGKSFSTRLVRAKQNDDILFTAQASFQHEETSHMEHQTKVRMPEGPDGLLDARTLMSNSLKEAQNDKLTPAQLFMAYKLAEFPPTFHRIFEACPVNQNVYKPDLKGPLHNTTYDMWIKPVLNIGDDKLFHQYMAAYISDSTMVETAIIPHLAQGFIVGMAFSLDHCIWFHRTKFNMNDWMLWEQKSDFAGGSRTHTIARLWNRTGELLMTAVQEGVARAPLKK